MSEKPESKKKKSMSTETPVHTIREGSVAASIWRRQSPSGYAYYDFSLARSWQSLSTGSAGSSRNFFSRNREELIKVVDAATQWIAQHETSDRESLAA